MSKKTSDSNFSRLEKLQPYISQATGWANFLGIVKTMFGDNERQIKEACRSGWLPIETAPKDGTRIFVYSSFYKAWYIASYERGGWEEEVRGFKTGVTHWMPLPSTDGLE